MSAASARCAVLTSPRSPANDGAAPSRRPQVSVQGAAPGGSADLPPARPRDPGQAEGAWRPGPGRRRAADPAFEQAVERFVAYHLAQRAGDARDRLASGLGHAELLFLEEVWWPAVGHFRHLHPEYEVRDRGLRRRFVDFAYVAPGVRLAIEIDGYNFHAPISRAEFVDQIRRQNLLALDGWTVLRFAYDDVRSDPRYCRQTILEFLGREAHRHDLFQGLTPHEQAALRFALDAGRPIAPSEVARALGSSAWLARKILRQLVRKGHLEPASGRHRVRRYRLSPTRLI